VKSMTLREIQHEELFLLYTFKDYCNQLGIKWSVAYGTLLGAVRHKGFIPWDDDVDVLVSRSSYQQLIANPLETREIGTIVPGDGDGPWLFPKVYSKRTLWNETFTRHSDKLGVFIDVFPWDEVSKETARSYFLRVQRRCKPYFYSYSFDYSDVRYQSPKGRMQRAIGNVGRLRSRASYRTDIDSLISESIGEDGFVNFFSSYSFEKEYVDAEKCKEVTQVEFEGESFPCLGNPEMHLRRVYGEDWMTPIKHDEHLHGKAYWR
jgi:phosphorylcholine metabolism protein LicD